MLDDEITRTIDLDAVSQEDLPTISHYQILGKIGEGGMGIVYKAIDLKLKRKVALKFLNPQTLKGSAEKRSLIREAQAAASLDHPNICTVYQIDEVDGQVFISMAFTEGQNLKQKIRTGHIPLKEALHIAIQVAKGLEAAHQKGIVHRDIKSSNIMVTNRGHARIMDFGLASTPEPLEITRTDRVLGTPAYMSPEQIRGEPVDRRADIWAWAVMVYEMLTGKLPFTGDHSAALLYSVLNLAPKPLSVVNPEIPPGVERIVERALSKRPEDRYQSFKNLLRELQPKQSHSLEDTWTGPPDQARNQRSIAVLPFTDMSADRDQEYFCDGISEEIINNLAQVKGIRVAARTSAFAFKGKNEDIREIGRKLRVSTLLEGSVRKFGNRVRITSQLLNVADGYHLWSERYDRELEDVFAIQEEIAHRIVQALRVELSDQERDALKKQATRNVEAYDFYLRGRQFFYRSKRESIEYALEMFARAIEYDPDYALALAGTADCYSYLFMYYDSDEANLAAARSASTRSLELDPELAEAHAAHGLVLSLTEDFEHAEREFKRAIELNSKLFEAHYFYARTCFGQGRLEQAAQLFEQASHVNPDDYQAVSLLACTFKGLRKSDEAKAAYARSIKRIKRRLELNPDEARAYYLGAHALLELGEQGESEKWVQRALAMEPDNPYNIYGIACYYAQLDRLDQALDYLEKALNLGFAHKGWIKNDNDLDPLRDHSRFQTLVRQLQ